MTTETTPSAATVQLRALMQDMYNRVCAWWRRDGLGHVSEVSFTENGLMKVEFSCSPYSSIQERMYNLDKSLSEATRRAMVVKEFEERGFVMLAEPGRDVGVLDCDTGNQALQKLIKDTFPSSVVWNMATSGTNSGAFVLRSMTVLIRNLDDVLALPKEPHPDY